MNNRYLDAFEQAARNFFIQGGPNAPDAANLDPSARGNPRQIRVPTNVRYWVNCAPIPNCRFWPEAAVPNVRRKQTTENVGLFGEGCFAAPVPKGSRRPTSAGHALHNSRCEWPVSRRSRRSSMSQAWRAIF